MGRACSGCEEGWGRMVHGCRGGGLISVRIIVVKVSVCLLLQIPKAHL